MKTKTHLKHNAAEPLIEKLLEELRNELEYTTVRTERVAHLARAIKDLTDATESV